MGVFTRKDFLTGSVAMAAATGVRGALGAVNKALATPDVIFKDLQTVKLLNDGGRVYALSCVIPGASGSPSC